MDWTTENFRLNIRRVKPLSTRALALSLLSFSFFAGCKEPPREKAPPAPTKTPPPAEGPDWKAAFKHEVILDPGKKAVVVNVNIAPGYHAYTVGETIGKPMLVKIDEDSAWTSTGDVEYPKGTEKNLPIGKSVIVEGQATIVAPVEKRGDGQAKGKFRYQICTDEACDRPRTVDFAVDG